MKRKIKYLWWLLLLPNLCLARIVQIDDLVKKEKTYPEGTLLHETTGHILRSDRILPAEKYQEEPIFRYRFGGVVKEGAKQYVKIVVQNLLRENLVEANRNAWNSSKGESPRADAIASSAFIELLVPVVKGGAVFDFPVHVVTESTIERVEVMEAALVIQGERLKVIDVADKIFPASKLLWVPPRSWPSETQTTYLDTTDEHAGSEPVK